MNSRHRDPIPGNYSDLDAFELPYGETSDQLLDIRKLLAVIWRGKWLLVLLCALGLVLGTLLAQRQVPVYRATASILFEPERLQIIEIADLLAETDSRSNLANQIEILTSTTLLERVVDTLGFASVPTPGPPDEVAEPSVEADPAEDDASEGLLSRAKATVDRLVESVTRPVPADVSDPSDPGVQTTESAAALTEEEQQARARRNAVQWLRNNLSLTQITGSRVIEIEFSSPDAKEAATVANTIGEEYIAFQQILKNQDVDTVVELMNRRIEDLKSRLDESQETLEQARLELSERQAQSLEMTEIQLNSLNAELARIRLLLTDAQARRDRAATALATGEELWSVTEFRDSSMIAGFRQREIELREQIAGERAITGESVSPSSTVNRALLDQVRQSIREEAGYIIASLQFEVESLQQREAQLQEMVRSLEVTSIEQSADQLQIERLQREVLANQTLYQSFVDRLREISEQANIQSADARFLSRADTPGQPDNQDRIRLLTTTGVGGLLIGLFVVLLRERINNAFHHPKELAEASGLPVLASIPMSGRRKDPRKLVRHFLANPRGILAESIRNLRTSVLYSDPGNKPKVVMFTSSQPGEGKTLVSMLTGVASQQTGRNAILVCCDLRNRSSARLYAGFPRVVEGAKPGLGLAAVFEKRCSLEEALVHEPESELHMLAIGIDETFGESPADVFSSDRFIDMMNDLRDRYDLVVLDTPPVLAVTDARLLSRISDTIVYLVRWNETNRNAVVEGLRELSTMQAHVVGCAFTLVSQRKARKYADNEFFYKKGYSGYYG